MDLVKVDTFFNKWHSIVSQESAYAHLQQQALIKEIHSSFNLAEILYFLTVVPQNLVKTNHPDFIAQYQRFTVELISSLSSAELSKYQKLLKKCNLHLESQGHISPVVYETKLKEVENSWWHHLPSIPKVLKSLHKKIRK